MAVITGNAKRNILTGTGLADVIQGLGGDDRLFGLGGADILRGGNENDLIDGGSGNDSLFGDSGSDTLLGGSGNDKLFGGTWSDTLAGGDGNDILDGGSSNDTLIVGRGFDSYGGGLGVDTISFAAAVGIGSTIIFDDTGRGRAFVFTAPGVGSNVGTLASIEIVIGGAGRDTIAGSNTFAYNQTFIGGGGQDILLGGAGHDKLYGGADHDTLEGGSGNDIVDGGAGDDYLTGNAGADRLVGGSGFDWIFYRQSTGVKVDLANSANNAGAEAVGDTFSGIENVWGTGGNDTLSGDGANNILTGGGGSDILTGGAGSDTFQFSAQFSPANPTPVGAGDLITDFTQGVDKIDISAMAGPLFVFLNGGNVPFTLAAPEITFGFAVENGQDRTVIRGDINGDAAAEFEIKISGFILLTANDFIL